MITTVIISVAVVVASANPTGPLSAKSKLEEVATVEAVMNQSLAGKDKLTAVFATADELRTDLAAFGVYSKVDLEAAVKQAVSEQKPESDQPKSFAAVDAVVEPASSKNSTHTIAFFDAAGHVAKIMIHERKPPTFVLFTAPNVRDGNLADYTADVFRKDRALAPSYQHFVKKNGSWAEAPALSEPPPPKVTCADVMKSVAKRVYVSEASYWAETDKYSTKLADIGFENEVKGAVVTVKKADAKAFLAEIAYAGGKATIDNENAFTVVTACKDAP